MTTQRKRLLFNSPGSVEVQTEALPPGQPGEVLIETKLSAISAGTEKLVYKGQVPPDMTLDAAFDDMAEPVSYPLTYGYQLVGEVIETKGAPTDLIGKRVFAFQPHQSHCWVPHDQVVQFPEHLTWQDAVFLPSMETALGVVQDGRPIIGERVVIIGLGVIGLLTTALLAQHPLAALHTVDPISLRREKSLELGASSSCAPDDAALAALAGQGGADLIYELSGNPKAAQAALALSGFVSRVILGSWYGTKAVELELGGAFHRNRVQIKSSQVSTIDPSLAGRWSKARRFELAFGQLQQLTPSRLISHSLPLARAQEAYQLLTGPKTEVLQIVFTYQDS